MAIISIFSGSHCHGEETAAKTAVKLNYQDISDELISGILSRFNLSGDRIHKTFTGSLPPFSKFTHEREKNTAMIRLGLAEMIQRDNIIIPGYFGHLIPRTIAHHLKVLIIANHEYRVQRAVETEGLSQKNAVKAIHKDDKERTEWTQFILDKPCYDEDIYDIVVPMHSVTVDEAVKLICGYANGDAVRITDRSRQSARDFIPAAKVWLELVKDGHEVDVYSEDGIVTIIINKYVVRLDKYEEGLIRLAQRVEGVKKVKTKTGPKFSPPSIIPMGELDMPSKILLVDDEKEFVQTLSERLSTRNLDSSVVYDGEQALDFVERDEPEVMVLDLKMPGIDGIEVLRRVKREHPNVEVIILTGHGSEKEETIAEELGAFAYLHKPVNVDLLAQVMREAYKKVNESKRKMNDENEK